MKDFATDYDPKTHSFSVEHHDIFKYVAKEKDVAKCITLKQFHVGVQVSLDPSISVAKPVPIQDAAQEAAQSLEKKATDEVNSLVTKLEKLQQEEKNGNKKAAAEGEKELKASKKKLETLAADFGPDIREAVENALKSELKTKVKARSANRSTFRGMELKDEFFQEKGDSIEEKPEFGKLAKTLSASGKELFDMTDTEKGGRKQLAELIREVQVTIEKLRGNNQKFDIGDFAKSHAKEVREMRVIADTYADHVSSMSDRIAEVEGKLKQFNKLVDAAKEMPEQKSLQKEIGDYEKALATIKGTLKDKTEAAEEAQGLLEEDYKNGEGWKKLLAQLDSIKAAAKSGGILEAAGKKIEKIAKG
jgi:hypothetical protein